MGNEKPVTVIVVNWNNRDLLRECLLSLRRQTYRNFHIIVVDNNSIDGSKEMLENEFAGFVYMIRNSRNKGFCGAVNQAIRASKSDFVALLNNDAEAQPNWLEEMVNALERAENLGLCACKILMYDQPGVIDKVGHLIYPDGQNRGRGTGQVDHGQFDQEGEALFPDGCAALYRREVFDQAGLFDEDFFAYGDDAELGLRARLSGWGAVYCPRAIVYHHHSQSLGEYSPQKVFYVERNRLWLAIKLFPVSLLLLNPYYAGLRFLAGALAGLVRRGDSGNFVREHSMIRLVWTMLGADLAAMAGFPRMWRKRTEVKKVKKISNSELRCLLQHFRLSLKELAFGAKPTNRPQLDAVKSDVLR
jgi:GT2 family glycosyltransferase